MFLPVVFMLSGALLASAAISAPFVEHPSAEYKPVILVGLLPLSERRKISQALEKRDVVPLIENAPGGSDSQYLLTVGVGTPVQSIPCQIDTGSHALFFPTQCTDPVCLDLPEYVPSASSTFQNLTQPAALQYGKGGASGYLASDTVVLGNLTVANQTFLAATTVDDGNNHTASDPLPIAPDQCTIGFSFGTIPDGGNATAPNVIENLVTQKSLPQNLFGLYLGRAGSVPNAASYGNSSFSYFLGSEVALGAPDTSKYTGSFDTVPLIANNSGFWTATVAGLAINNATMPGTSINIMFDSGFTLGQLPRTYIEAMAAPLGAVRNDSAGAYTLPCANNNGSVSVGFQINQTTFNFDPNDLITPLSGSTCQIALSAVDTAANPDFNITGILGDTWLKGVYTVYGFDNGGYISVATLSSTAGNNVAPASSSGAAVSSAASGAVVAAAAATATNAARSQGYSHFVSLSWTVGAIVLSCVTALLGATI